MNRGTPSQESTMAKCVRKKRIRSSVTGKMVTRCAKFSGTKRKSRRKSHK